MPGLKEYSLKKELQTLDVEKAALEERLRTEHDEAKRSELRTSLEGMIQRKLALQKEHELFNKINRSELGMFLYFISKTWELFKSLDKAAWEFRECGRNDTR